MSLLRNDIETKSLSRSLCSKVAPMMGTTSRCKTIPEGGSDD